MRRIFFILFFLVAMTSFHSTQTLSQSNKIQNNPSIEVHTILGSDYLSENVTGILISIQNKGENPLRGNIYLKNVFVKNQNSSLLATIRVEAHSKGYAKIPLSTHQLFDASISVEDERGIELVSKKFVKFGMNQLTLVDIRENSPVYPLLRDLVVNSPWYSSGYASGRSINKELKISVSSPFFDSSNGDPLLPEQGGLYSDQTAVLIPSSQLVKLPLNLQKALASYVIAGGSLGLVVDRLEDLRHSSIVSMCGSNIFRIEKNLSTTNPPTEKLDKSLSTSILYGGGNLQTKNSASYAVYGLGTVHILPFDPYQKEVLSKNENQRWLVQWLLESEARKFAWIGGVKEENEYSRKNYSEDLRKRMDPNQGYKWTVPLATLMILIFAILAGPVGFAMARKKKNELSAWTRIPFYASFTFLIVICLGLLSRGISKKAIHLVFLDSGAGMSVAKSIRWRGFFSPKKASLDVYPTSSNSLLREIGDPYENNKIQILDQTGIHFPNLSIEPQQTSLIEEETISNIGKGVRIISKGKDTEVTNRTGRNLRSVLFKPPSGSARFYENIPNGATKTLNDGVSIDSLPAGQVWSTRVGSISDVWHPLPQVMNSILSSFAPDEKDLADSWEFLDLINEDQANWFPPNTPILLAQIDDGEGELEDTKIRIVKERILLRVVGYGE